MATTLLLVFALVIGTITMNWGKGYVDKLSEEESSPSKTVVISQADVDEPLKDVMVEYLEGRITKEEYNQRVKEISN